MCFIRVPEADPESRTPGQATYLGGAGNPGCEVGGDTAEGGPPVEGVSFRHPPKGATELHPVEEL